MAEPSEGIEVSPVRRADPAVLVAAVLVLAVPVAAVVSALRHPWVGISDWALVETAVRDVGTGETPLVGAHSRFGWHHPGPWPFYLMAVFYRLAPADHGLLFAAAASNLLFTAGYVAVVRRHPRGRALVALAGMAVLLRGLGVAFLADPWNPHVAVVPLALYLLLCVEIARGEGGWWALPAAVGVGSFAVQAHLGLVLPVLLAAAATYALRRPPPWPLGWRRSSAAASGPGRLAGPDAAAGSSLRRWLRRLSAAWRLPGAGASPAAASDLTGRAGTTPPERAARLRRRSGWAAVGVGVVAWLPPVVDQVVGDGNLWRLVRWTGGAELRAPSAWERGRPPAGEVVSGAAWLLDPGGLWAGRFSAPRAGPLFLLGDGAPWRFLLVAALLTATAVAVARTGDRAVRAAGVLALAGVVAVVGGLAGTRGLPFLWSLRWAAAVVLLAWVAFGWAVVALAADRRPSPRVVTAAAGLAFVAVAVPVVLALGWGSTGDQPSREESELWLAFRPDVLEVLREEEPVVVQPNPMVFGDENVTLEVLLDRAGIRWVPGDHPDAGGRPTFFVVRSVDGGGGTALPGVVARSGPAEARAFRPGELLLVRAPPDAPVSPPRRR